MKKNFKLSKVKRIKNGGLDIHYTIEETEGSEVFNPKIHLEHPKDFHPDLTDKLGKLKPILARIYHLTFFTELMGLNEFEATQEQEEIAMKLECEIMDKITVNGVTFSGSDKNRGIVISGSFTADTNQAMPINSHNLKFSSTRYGFEEEVERICEELKDEVYAYVYENKRAQMSLFDIEEFSLDGLIEEDAD